MTAPTTPTAEELGERLLAAVLGTQLVQAAYLGDRLGYYRTLAAGPHLRRARGAHGHGRAVREGVAGAPGRGRRARRVLNNSARSERRAVGPSCSGRS
jgi:hypothetical protein